VRAGYATVGVNAGPAPYGTAVFGLTQNGILVSEAGVPASPPTKQARIFIDYRPGDGTSDSAISINTGFAIANTGTVVANLTFRLRGAPGMDATPIAHGTLAPGAHTARFIDQLQQIAPDFAMPTGFNGFGTLEIASDQPVSIVALRMTINQRAEALLTTVPAADLSKWFHLKPIYFPQFADGGGYNTLVALMNTSSGVEAGRIVFTDDNGAPLPVGTGIAGNGQSTYGYSIPAGGVFTLQSDGLPPNVNVGAVQVIPDPLNLTPVGAAVFGFSSGGVTVTESGVPAATPTKHARIYVDRSGGYDTGIATASTGDATRVTLAAYQLDGTTPIGTGAIDLVKGGHAARFVGQLIADLPADFTGVLDISAPSPIAALTLRSFVNQRKDFLMTTLPVADFANPAPSPIVFPQIADGGGYTTQIILLSTTDGVDTTVRFYDSGGKPLSVR
jgi:hypothetical protein